MDNFEKQKSNLIRNKELAEERLAEAKEKYNSIENSEIDRKEQRLEIAMKAIAMKKRALEQISDKLEFLRPENEEDMSYRSRQYKEFPKRIKETVPNDLPLRFHGCPIYTAERILQSGELSSSVDRIGIETSYDAEGQVSVTTKDTIDTTVHGYSDLGGNQNLPAGCIFVLLPKDEKDEEIGQSMMMGNVSFKEEPERLFAIITSPENISRVKGWSKESGVDLTKVHDFDSFIKIFDKQKDNTQGNVLESAIEATESSTRTGELTQQLQDISRIEGERVEKKPENKSIGR
ncbi:MAG: hypothetical protein ACM3UU_00105 [Ignavibacteriales bacterium]